jgi:LSD1 subclass zinc finger protein
LAFFQVKCPNCSAPLELPPQCKAAKCSYCGSTFIPNPEIQSRKRSDTAAERTAAELAIPRLVDERVEVTGRLQRLQYLAELPRCSAIAANNDALQAFKDSAALNEKECKTGRNGLLTWSVVPFGLMLFTSWSWPWYLFFLFLISAALAHVRSKRLAMAH